MSPEQDEAGSRSITGIGRGRAGQALYAPTEAEQRTARIMGAWFLGTFVFSIHADAVWGDHLAKRSQLVADLADQVHDRACQGDAWPVWAASGSHPSLALIGEIAVWRAGNGINPQDPQPTGGTQLETLPTLWKQRLDRYIARPPTRQQM